MSRVIIGFRHKDGHAIHDGDCYFWGHSICTCGLLHKLMTKTEPEEYYPAYTEESLKQERALRKVEVRDE